MAEGPSPAREKVKLRKYPNRRYYDTSRSRYVTLEEIYLLIRNGCDVEVEDSKTGEDITCKVLAQIILDHDPPKLGIFPVDLLHQLIRTNEPLVRDFVDKYFNHALRAFLQSQRQFDGFLRQALGLNAALPINPDWTRMMMGPFLQSFYPGGGEPSPGATGTGAGPREADLRRLITELQEQVARLQEQLERR